MKDIGRDEVSPLAANKTDTRIPYDISARFLHPCIERDSAEFSPAKWILIASWAIVHFYFIGPNVKSRE